MADYTYPLTIYREEEEITREAAKQVNLKMNMYRDHFPSLPPERVLTMVAYDFSLKNLKQEQRNDTRPFVETIEEMTEILEDCFKEK
ncbi:hypothetical protein EZS27_042330 [termite gut metagenome]|uniref:Cell division protein ZapA n=1 Tax=termite gut metagenome TaxID=433724 RepID=A0A5J4P998_9ZZZZ